MTVSTNDPTQHLETFDAAYRRGDINLAYPPVTVSIEATNTCNLRCPMCPVSQDYGSVSRGFMSELVFDRVLEEITPFKPRVSMNIGGESTLHPRLPDMVRRLVDAGSHVCVDTNATRLTRELSSALIEAGLPEVVFCLDGNSRESYEAIRKRGEFTRTIDNIREFLEVKKELGAELPYTVIKNIQHWRPEDDLAFPPAFTELFEATPPDEYRATWMDHWPGKHRDGLAEWYDAEPFEESGYQPCMNLWKNLPVSWDGKVYLCCLDLKRTSPVGDVLTSGVLGVWNAPALVEARRQHVAGEQAVMPLCHNCNQIRRTPDDADAGLSAAGEDRFTPWAREHPQLPLLDVSTRDS